MKYITTSITAIDSPYLTKFNTGLGNVLFQLSSIYGISKKLNINCSFPFLKIYCDKIRLLFNYNHDETIFRNIINININNKIEYDNKKIYDDLNRTYSYNLINYLQNNVGNKIICSYLENYNYFHEYRNDILELFSIDNKSKEYIDNKYGHIFNSNKIIISVHYRYGNDIISANGDKIDHSFYYNSLKYMIKKYDDIIFLFFTDDKNCINLSIFDFKFEYEIINGNIDYIDLWLISKCDHHIIQGSTFSWWGTYLNNNKDKIIICDKNKSHNIYCSNFLKF